MTIHDIDMIHIKCILLIIHDIDMIHIKCILLIIHDIVNIKCRRYIGDVGSGLKRRRYIEHIGYNTSEMYKGWDIR